MLSPSSREFLQPISTLIEGLYYTSKIERSAYSDTVYDEPKYAEIINYIKLIVEYSNASKILGRKPEVLEEKWRKYKESFHIPVTDKFKNYEDFIRWASDEINYKGNITLKKLNKVRYLGQQNIKKGNK